MKRIVLGSAVALGLFAFACGSSGGGGGTLGPECTKYVNCLNKLGGTYKDTATSFSTSCNTSSAASTACETGCPALTTGLSSAFTDGGSC